MSNRVARRPQAPVAGQPVLSPASHSSTRSRSVARSTATAQTPVESRHCADIAIEEKQVAAFLCEHGLGMYTATILRDGFDEMEILLAAEDADIKSWDMKLLDVACLRRALRGYQQALNSEAAVFLKQHDLLQYRAPLFQQGFTEMATLADMTEDDMRQIGLLRGHALRLKRELREYREALGSSTCAGSAESELRRPSSPPTSGRSQASVAPSQHRPQSEGRAFDAAVETRAALLKSWEMVQEAGTVPAANLLMKHLREMDAEALRVNTSHARPKTGETDEDAVRKLAVRTVQILGSAATGMSDTVSLVQHLHKVGAGFAGTGIKEGYFAMVRDASPFALRELLGDRFTADIASACRITGPFLASLIIAGFRSVEDQ